MRNYSVKLKSITSCIEYHHAVTFHHLNKTKKEENYKSLPELNVQEYVEHISAKGFENLHELTKKKSLKKQSYIYIYKLKVCFRFQLHSTTTSNHSSF